MPVCFMPAAENGNIQGQTYSPFIFLHFCPKKTILKKSETVNKMGYYAVEAVDMTDCVACGICATVCPEGAIMVEKDV